MQVEQLPTEETGIDRDRRRKIFYPILILLIAVLLAFILFASRPQLEPQVVVKPLTTVRIITAEPVNIHMTVKSQGTVQPRTEIELIPEVSGKVAWISPSLVSGGHFNQGDPLLRVDAHDYINTLGTAEALLIRAEADMEYTRYEYQRLSKLESRDLASRSQAEETQRAFRVTEAALKEARISLRRAALDVQRTNLAAPFSGRVRSEQVDMGQFVSRGNRVATLYGTDVVEIRLPIADQQMAFLDRTLINEGVMAAGDAPSVRLYAEFAGKTQEWSGRLIRTEGEIDARSRMIFVVAQVENSEHAGGPPLPVGLFVEAEIQGLLTENVYVLPRSAMRDEGRLLVLDQDNRLHFRRVELLRIEHDRVVIKSGLQAGERVCISPLQTVVDGMQVIPVEPGDQG
jgi:RND family efflux transporter MFP subunit